MLRVLTLMLWGWELPGKQVRMGPCLLLLFFLLPPPSLPACDRKYNLNNFEQKYPCAQVNLASDCVIQAQTNCTWCCLSLCTLAQFTDERSLSGWEGSSHSKAAAHQVHVLGKRERTLQSQDSFWIVWVKCPSPTAKPKGTDRLMGSTQSTAQRVKEGLPLEGTRVGLQKEGCKSNSTLTVRAET